MTPVQLVALAAFMRIKRRLAPPAVAVREAMAFLEMPPHLADEKAALAIIRTKTRADVLYGLAGYLLRHGYPESATTLQRIGWDIGETAVAREATGETSGWSDARIEELYAGWLLGDADVCDPLYKETA